MITEDEKKLISAVYSAMRKVIPSFRSRSQQREMVGEISNSLADKSISLIQAATGVGKTAGYLIPSLAIAASRDLRLVVSTNTTALQDQIDGKDMPIIIEAFRYVGIKIKSTTMKGRERYVCPIALENSGTMGDLFGEVQGNEIAHQLHVAYMNGNWNGVRDTFPEQIDTKIWQGLKNSRHSCVGEKCSTYKECPYFTTTQHALAANVIIANHDLVLSGIANNENSIFAEFDKNIYVFDEGHHLEAKALNSFATRFVVDVDWIERLPALVSLAGAGEYRKACDNDVRSLLSMMKALDVVLGTYAGDRDIVRFENGKVPDYLIESFSGADDILMRLQSYATKSLASLKSGRARVNDQLVDRYSIDLGSIVGSIEELNQAWKSFFTDDPDAYINAKWIERTSKQWKVCESPFNAAPILKAKLWKHIQNGLIITSATLAPCGSFDQTKRALGLYDDERVRTLALNSPFDYSRAKLIIPPMECGPENIALHTKEVIRHVKTIMNLSEGGVLVLFSSDKQMRDVYKGLSKDLKSKVMLQNDSPTAHIIETHKQKIDNGEVSTIFGLASFAEGIDLPGKYCVSVVIAKIPFPVPDEPILAAASEWIEKKGGNKFASLMLPIAWIRLLQAIGRLMRTETDYGHIFLLDSRIRKPYGKNLLSGVPLPVVWDGVLEDNYLTRKVA